MIDQQDFEMLDNRYLKKSDYEQDQKDLNKRLQEGVKKFAILETQMNTIKWIGIATFGSVITLLIQQFWGV